MNSRPDNGFTLVEALISLLILSLLFAGVSAFSSGGISAISRSQTASHDAAAISGFDAMLLAEAQKVRPPFWDRRGFITDGEGRFVCGYYEGIRGQMLEIENTAGGLRLRGGSHTKYFPQVRLKSAAPLFSKGGHARGIELCCDINGRSCVFDARFGSSALECDNE